ncbi:MAG: (Fe-S)-binding protein [Planctomycetes bacterium]|nr:(Fe-S)-binding protein [Planctomycetota bacterium]
MFSDKAVKTFEGCRFCPMCRHICPVGLVTGNEGNTPRAKALLANYVARGMKYSAEMASDMYECYLCYACANSCESGYEPPIYIREARTMAAVEGLAPPAVQKLIDNLEKTDNIFGLPKEDRLAAVAELIPGLPDKADTLLYIGATAIYKTPDIAAAFIKLLKKAGIAFTVMLDEPSSGAELGDLIGFVDEVRQVAAKCVSRFNECGAKEIIVLDPASARLFKQRCEEWGLKLRAGVISGTAYIARLLKDEKLRPHIIDLSATFQDDSILTRELDETEAPREIMAALGINLKEMFLNRKQVKSCGSVLAHESMPRLTQLTGQARWADALRTGRPVLLTASPDVYYVMKKTQPEGMKLQDLFVLLEQNC